MIEFDNPEDPVTRIAGMAGDSRNLEVTNLVFRYESGSGGAWSVVSRHPFVSPLSQEAAGGMTTGN